jgi:hypothetical protein
MPLNDAAAKQVAQAIVAQLNVPDDVQQEALSKWEAVVNQIFTGIVANALVVPTALVAPPGAAGGPVVGVGSVT